MGIVPQVGFIASLKNELKHDIVSQVSCGVGWLVGWLVGSYVAMDGSFEPTRSPCVSL